MQEQINDIFDANIGSAIGVLKMRLALRGDIRLPDEALELDDNATWVIIGGHGAYYHLSVQLRPYILNSADLKDNPISVLRRLFAFLEECGSDNYLVISEKGPLLPDNCKDIFNVIRGEWFDNPFIANSDEKQEFYGTALATRAFKCDQCSTEGEWVTHCFDDSDGVSGRPVGLAAIFIDEGSKVSGVAKKERCVCPKCYRMGSTSLENGHLQASDTQVNETISELSNLGSLFDMNDINVVSAQEIPPTMFGQSVGAAHLVSVFMCQDDASVKGRISYRVHFKESTNKDTGETIVTCDEKSIEPHCVTIAVDGEPVLQATDNSYYKNSYPQRGSWNSSELLGEIQGFLPIRKLMQSAQHAVKNDIIQKNCWRR